MQFHLGLVFVIYMVQISQISADEEDKFSVATKRQIFNVSTKTQEIYGNLYHYRTNFQQLLSTNLIYGQNVADVKFHEIENDIINYATNTVNEANISRIFLEDHCFKYAKATTFKLYSIGTFDSESCVQAAIGIVEPHFLEVDYLIIAIRGLQQKLKAIPYICREPDDVEKCAKEEVKDLREAIQRFILYSASLRVSGETIKAQAILNQEQCTENTLLNMKEGAAIIKSATHECIQRKQKNQNKSF